MRTQSKSKLHPALRMQAAWRLLEPGAKGTIKSVMKRYDMTERELKLACLDFLNGNFKKDKSWNPAWEDALVIHHPVDTAVMVDIGNGSDKGSDIDLMFDPDFDPVNGMLHVRWTSDDVLALCEGIPYRVLEILRDSKPGDELYQEAVEMADSQIFKMMCSAYGIDADAVLLQALNITKADI